jgi:hypothetical protein
MAIVVQEVGWKMCVSDILVDILVEGVGWIRYVAICRMHIIHVILKAR